jgi:type IV pilus assembly protein PilM
MLTNTNKQTLGLDIGSAFVKTVVINENQQNDENIIESVKQCLGGFDSTRMAVAGLCGNDVAVRRFSFPALPAEQMDNAAQFEASQVMPIDIKKSSVDYQVINSENNNHRGILAAATNDHIEEKRNLISSSGLKCCMMDVNGLALINCYQNTCDEQIEKAVAIIDVGSEYTNIAIIGPDDFPFIRDLKKGADSVLETVSEKSGKQISEIKKIIETGQSFDETVSKHFYDANRKMIIDINETLRYYSNQEAKLEIGKILICGGFSLCEDFLSLMSSHLPAEVSLWNPFEKINYEQTSDYGKLLNDKGPAMALAAGLAMRTI